MHRRRSLGIAVVAFVVFLVACSSSGDEQGRDAGSSDGDGQAADLSARPTSTFTFERREQAVCPKDNLWCLGNWPPALRGEVLLYRSEEQRGDARHKRTFYAYVPKLGAPTRLPIWIMLHGGGGSALDVLATTALARMADRRGNDPGVAWQRNTETCHFSQDDSFVDKGGVTCTPDKVYFRNGQPFIAVFPEGIVDAGAPDKRHWEDGRDPSPGHGTREEQRDDVGFVDHVIEVLLAEEADRVDPARIYLAGISNGGMMTHRLLCSLTATRYPNLARIAAAAAQVGAMPEPLKAGLAGRERCPVQVEGASGRHQVAIASFMGRGVPTPDCTPFPCKSPTVSGDGLMPFGEPGGRYHVWSPDGGRVASAVDTHNHWRDYLVSATGVSKPTGQREVFGFTEIITVHYGDQPAKLKLVITDGGHHLSASSRRDIHVQARTWQFLHSFSRAEDGSLRFGPSSAVSGEY